MLQHKHDLLTSMSLFYVIGSIYTYIKFMAYPLLAADKLNTENEYLFTKHKQVWAHSISQICPHLCLSEIHDRNTRSAANCDLYIRLGRHKDVYRQSLGYIGAIAWNNLDPRIRV